MNPWTQDIEYEKPVMYSEAGSMPIWGCDDQEVEIQREIYKAVFSGLAGYLEWEIQRKNYYFDFRPLKSFLSGINYESLDLHPGFVELDNNEWIARQPYIDRAIGDNVDITYLRSEDKSFALGVITNRTYNYITRGGCYASNYYDENNNYFGSINNEEVESDIFIPITENLSNRLKLSNMDNDTYKIEYFDLNNNPLNVISFSNGKKVRIRYPELTEKNWMILFKAEKYNSKSLETHQEDAISGDLMQDKSVVLYPTPARDRLTIECNKEIERIRVLNTMGEGVMQVRNNAIKRATSGELLVRPLSPGVYHIQLFFQDGSAVVKKFIKQ